MLKDLDTREEVIDSGLSFSLSLSLSVCVCACACACVHVCVCVCLCYVNMRACMDMVYTQHSFMSPSCMRICKHTALSDTETSMCMHAHMHSYSCSCMRICKNTALSDTETELASHKAKLVEYEVRDM